MFHFIICDADELFCKKEKQFIIDYYGRRGIEAAIDIFHSGDEIISLGEKLSVYDALFLDVSIGKVNGIDLGTWLNAASYKLTIVFVSGHMSYALDGYKVGAARYIMKDDSQFNNSMEECLNYILRKSGEDNLSHMVTFDEKTRIPTEKILYVESRAHKVIYYPVAGSSTRTEYAVYGKLGDIEKELKDFGFCRTHQSYLVNMQYAQDVRRYKVTLLNGMEIQISKKYYKAVEDEFSKLNRPY